VTANPSSAKRIGVVRDPELVAIAHNHSKVRLPPVALGSRFRTRPYAGRPRRWVGRHLLDQCPDAVGDEPILLDPPLPNGLLCHAARWSG